MNHETARGLLGIGTNASHSEIETAWQHRQEEVLARLKRASSSADRQQCMNDLEALQAARDLQLSGAEPSLQRSAAASAGLSQTKLADLPVGDTFDTASSAGGNEAQILSLNPGDKLSGRFEIQQQIGAGGMGVVYRALDTNRDEAIALKVMQPGLLSNEGAKQRFMSEAKIAIGLSHPYIVKTYDVQKDGVYLYLTMELLQGQSLRDAMNARKQAGKVWTNEEVIGIATSLCDALSYAHNKTIHRDLKPENVWLEKDGQTKLMDFGIAKLLCGSQLTQTSTVMGTAYYMAPEQLQGARDIDHRADQYAVSVMIYELLTGKVPTGRFKSLKDVKSDISPRLSDAVDKALENRAEDRYQNISSFLQALRQVDAGSKPKIESTATPPKPKIESLKRFCQIIYALYGMALILVIFGLPYVACVSAIVAVIINYIKVKDTAGTWLESHFRWQIRTFWFGLMWLFIGALIMESQEWGALVVIVSFSWIIYRVAKGLFNLNKSNPMHP